MARPTPQVQREAAIAARLFGLPRQWVGAEKSVKLVNRILAFHDRRSLAHFRDDEIGCSKLLRICYERSASPIFYAHRKR